MLYPPAIAPPPSPLPLWRFVPTFVRNPLRTLPAPVYREPIFVPPAFHGRFAWITDPALVERVLLEEHEHFPKSPVERRVFEPIIGDGILTAEGASWRWQRRMAAPIFRHVDLLGLVPRMAAAAERTVERWRAITPARGHRIDADMTDATFDVLESTIFAGATPEESQVLKHHISAYLERTSWEIAYEIVRFPRWVWHPAKRPMRRLAYELLATMRSVIHRERAKGWPGGGLMARIGSARHPDTGEPMSDDQIAHNLLTFAAAGHETTAKALTWTLYLLARAPDWQDRVRREIASVAGAGPIGRDHIDALPLTRRVLKESMRLYPPAPIMGRMTREAIEIGGHRLKAGAMIVIPIWAIHRHTRLWDDPGRFDPDRFLPENEARHARTQYMPFGFGPRTCIGMSFAMIEAVVLLATFMRSIRVSCPPDLAPEPVSRVTLRPRNGMPLDITLDNPVA
jgi:cytochrome P450